MRKSKRIGAVVAAAVLSGCGLLGGGKVDVPAAAVQQSESGLSWSETRVGRGREAAAGAQVTVHYSGRLLDGKPFDSSYERGVPFKFKLGQGQVIKGWDEGLLGMREGGVRALTIPPHLAYGEKGAPPVIPPNATLLFDVELLRVE